MGFLSSIISKTIGTKNDRDVKRLRADVAVINSLEEGIKKLSDEELKAKTPEFKERLANGESLEDIKFEAFAVVRETARRVLGERHYDVQLIGGLALHEGTVVEMRTGEGKTLTSTAPVYLNALTGKGVHVITVNDYLAKRDAEWMGQIYNFLGLSVGVVVPNISEHERKAAYRADITYGTNNEFGFDYLRDNMKYSIDDLVQRELHYAIVDEVDSILIDEARTPLIISGPTDDDISKYYSVDGFIPSLIKDKHYVIDEQSKSVSLTDEGVHKIESLLNIDNLYDPMNIEWLHYVTQALRAHTLFKRDVDYVVKDNKVIIVDEFTGRLLPGRRFSDGLHQALEAKERVTVESENQTLATITFQNYFRMYEKLSGMTGTAATEAEEFGNIYKLNVLVVPTNKPIARIDYEDKIYKTEAAKFKAVVEDIVEKHKIGRPVLVGTVSIDKSEKLAKFLKKRGIHYNVLNAKQHAREAEIISHAGQKGAVTISTNMAGRGTDIKLGEGVRELGGLHVIGTERHESRRIDNQLRGRAGRQGDPGSSQFYVSLEDDLMRIFGGERLIRLMETFRMKDDEVIQHKWVTKSLENAQKKVEMYNFGIRKNLLDYDDVMNQQRHVIYSLRYRMLKGEELDKFFDDLIYNESYDIAEMFITKKGIDFEELNKRLYEEFAFKVEESELEGKDPKEFIYNKAKDIFNSKNEKLPSGVFLDIARTFYLKTIDYLWKEHLKNLDHLRESIGLRGYAQQDPVIAYKKEAFNMFLYLNERLNLNALSQIFRLDADIILKQYEEEERHRSLLEEYKRKKEAEQTGRVLQAKHGEETGNTVSQAGSSSPKVKVGRNDPCPCGSGKKYKHCCGR